MKFFLLENIGEKFDMVRKFCLHLKCLIMIGMLVGKFNFGNPQRHFKIEIQKLFQDKFTFALYSLNFKKIQYSTLFYIYMNVEF